MKCAVQIKYSRDKLSYKNHLMQVELNTATVLKAFKKKTWSGRERNLPGTEWPIVSSQSQEWGWIPSLTLIPSHLRQPVSLRWGVKVRGRRGGGEKVESTETKTWRQKKWTEQREINFSELSLEQRWRHEVRHIMKYDGELVSVCDGSYKTE